MFYNQQNFLASNNHYNFSNGLPITLYSPFKTFNDFLWKNSEYHKNTTKTKYQKRTITIIKVICTGGAIIGVGLLYVAYNFYKLFKK